MKIKVTTEKFVDNSTITFWYFSSHILYLKELDLCKQNDSKQLAHDKGNWNY